MSIRIAGATLIVGFVLVAACSSFSTDGAPSETPVPGSKWSANGLPVHTRLAATKDSIVYGGVEEKALYVVALDPATGKERWRRRSGVSARVQGVEQWILTDDDTAYFLEWRPFGHCALGAVTTATGEERWRREFWSVPVDPNARSCGDAVCIVAYTPRAKMWVISKSDGSDLADNSITADEGNGLDALLSIDTCDDADATADATLLMASRDVVYVSQFGSLGKTKEWSKPAAELFGQTPVSPDGGWGAWRDGDGWIAWLGQTVDWHRAQAGDVFPSGVVAGFDDQGNSRWIAADRHMCEMFSSCTPPMLCDGVSRKISEEQGELRPNVVEGRDATTGAVTWKLDLNGEIDEWKSAEKVLRIDDDRYLVGLSTGPVVLDLRHGPEPAPEDLTAGWCRPENKPEKITRWFGGDIFLQARNAFPCRLGGERADAAVPVPEFAGVNVAGWGAWVEDGQVHAKHQ